MMTSASTSEATTDAQPKVAMWRREWRDHSRIQESWSPPTKGTTLITVLWTSGAAHTCRHPHRRCRRTFATTFCCSKPSRRDTRTLICIWQGHQLRTMVSCRTLLPPSLTAANDSMNAFLLVRVVVVVVVLSARTLSNPWCVCVYVYTWKLWSNSKLTLLFGE